MGWLLKFPRVFKEGPLKGLLRAGGSHAYEWALQGPNLFPLPTAVKINAADINT
jgi:hypothetical protein